MTKASEQAIRDDERQKCAQTLRDWADETLLQITDGARLSPDMPLVLRWASSQLLDRAEHFSGRPR